MKSLHTNIILFTILLFQATVVFAAHNCITIPENEAIHVFDNYQLNSLDKSEMTAGVGSDNNALYFTPDTENGRALNVINPKGVAYLVKEGTTLRIEDDGVGDKVTINDKIGGCNELAAALNDDKTKGALIAFGIAAAGFMLIDNDSDETVTVTDSSADTSDTTTSSTTPSTSSSTTTPSTSTSTTTTASTDFCGIPGCSSLESYFSGRCNVVPTSSADLAACGISPNGFFCGIPGCSGCSSLVAGRCRGVSASDPTVTACGCTISSNSL